jgi:hypothetical protein
MPRATAEKIVNSFERGEIVDVEQGVAEGSGKNVVKSVKVGNFRHDLVDTGFGWQVRIYNGDELYDTGMSKNSEQKGLAALEDAVAYTEKQTRTKRQGVSEGWGFDQWGHDTWTDAQKEVARKKKNEKQRAQRQQNKDQQNKDQQKSREQGVAEGSLETDNMVSTIGWIIQNIYPRGGDKNTYMKLVAQEMPRIVKANPKLFRRAFGMAYDRFFHIDQDYTDYSMRQGERGMEEEKQKGVDGKACWKGYKRMGTKKKGGRTVDNCVKVGEDAYSESLMNQLNSIISEKAPPGDKYERMVKHIKKGYAKDGKISDKERSIAYATAWKAKNKAKK